MKIRWVLVVGGDQCGDDELYLVRVADRQEKILKKAALRPEDFQFE
jgi:ATP phosphoribosyltransferase regulatory subunit